MKLINTKIIETALFAIIFGFIAAPVYIFFSSALSGTDTNTFKSFAGAFYGAFFAFLFVRTGEGLTKIYERKSKHFNTLVRFQHYFNDCLNITGDNVFIADDYIRIFDDRTLAKKEPRVFFNVFHEYPIDSELLIGLTNIDFINEVYTLNVELRKLNDTMHAIDRSYDQIRRAFVEKNIDLDTYILNVKEEKLRYFEVKKFLLETKSDLVRLYSISRILTKSSPLLSRVITRLSRSKYPVDIENQVKEEMKKLNIEIEKNAEISAEKIRKTTEI